MNYLSILFMAWQSGYEKLKGNTKLSSLQVLTEEWQLSCPRRRAQVQPFRDCPFTQQINIR